MQTKCSVLVFCRHLHWFGHIINLDHYLVAPLSINLVMDLPDPLCLF